MGAFLSFDKFVTPAVVKIVYWIGIVAIVISGVVWSVGSVYYFGWIGPVIAIVSIVFGLLLWRVYCELVMLWFKLYDEMVGIRQNTAK
jgi:hypothetical protein